jgi:hypothetical protein
MATRNGIVRTAVSSAGIALAASLVLATNGLAVGYGPTIVLKAGEGALGDIDAANNIAVVWQEYNHNSVVRSYVRWSSDDGESFAPAVPLRGGAQADTPRVATCGGSIFASSTWRTNAGAFAGVDRWVVSGDEVQMADGFRMGRGFRPDVACRDDTVALAWFDDERVRIGVRWLDEQCTDPCVSAFEADIGAAPDADGLSIAATDRGFIVAWKDGHALRVRRVIAGVDLGTLTASLRPSTKVLEGASVWLPLIAAQGRRVVLAYASNNDTRIRISEDRGRSFGGHITLWNSPADANEEGSAPSSVDVRSGRILVELGFSAGVPGFPNAHGYLSSDDGTTWTETPEHGGSHQVGAMLADGVAQAWDNAAVAGFFDDIPPKIRFHTGPLPED